MRDVRRCCGFLRGVRTGESTCLSIEMAMWLTARSSEAGVAANGAMTTTIGVAGGKAKSARREKERGRDKDRSQVPGLRGQFSGTSWWILLFIRPDTLDLRPAG